MGFQQKKQRETISVARLEICQLIVTNSKDKNPATDFGCTPLSMAAKKGYTEIFQLIFDQVQEKNPADAHGYTPLHIAARYGSYEVCKLILKCQGEIDINALTLEEPSGYTAFMLASKRGYLDIVNLFLEELPEENLQANLGNQHKRFVFPHVSFHPSLSLSLEQAFF